MLRTDSELSYFKCLTSAGSLSTLLVAYFQNLSAYQDKVAAQAKNDIEAATQAFTDTSNALSTALALQQRLTINFYSAVQDDVYKNDDAYLTRDARSTYSAYLNAYEALHQNYNLWARKAEIYLDWASDVTRDPARNTSPSTDPIFMSLLGEYDFDCENDMPSFFGNTTTKLTDKNNPANPQLVVDWYSTQHHVLTIEYCFDVTHKRMNAVLQWASNSNIDAAQMSYMLDKDSVALFKVTRPTKQILRLNAFMSLAMRQIDQIPVKYRPNGFICSLPGVGGFLGLFDHCTPIRTASP